MTELFNLFDYQSLLSYRTHVRYLISTILSAFMRFGYGRFSILLSVGMTIVFSLSIVICPLLINMSFAPVSISRILNPDYNMQQDFKFCWTIRCRYISVL